MLAYQFVHHLCDLASLGSASSRPSFPDLALLSSYSRILAIYDSDSAGDLARSYLSQYPRVKIISPPSHDLTDYWRSGANLQSWLPDLFQ